MNNLVDKQDALPIGLGLGAVATPVWWDTVLGYSQIFDAWFIPVGGAVLLIFTIAVKIRDYRIRTLDERIKRIQLKELEGSD